MGSGPRRGLWLRWSEETRKFLNCLSLMEGSYSTDYGRIRYAAARARRGQNRARRRKEYKPWPVLLSVMCAASIGTGINYSLFSPTTGWRGMTTTLNTQSKRSCACVTSSAGRADPRGFENTSFCCALAKRARTKAFVFLISCYPENPTFITLPVCPAVRAEDPTTVIIDDSGVQLNATDIYLGPYRKHPGLWTSVLCGVLAIHQRQTRDLLQVCQAAMLRLKVNRQHR